MQGPRGPGFVYSGLALLGLVVLLTFTMTVNQPPPPTIAEFSPQAVEQIEDAPEEQTSDFGTGAEGPGEGEAAETPGETPPPVSEEGVEVPRVHRCVGDPPRQIEDPQSPPCVPHWDGDNGGHTSQGVTGNEVRLVVPVSPLFVREEVVPTFERFFNTRFEFYGRRLRLLRGPDQCNEDDCQQAAAQETNEHEPFASTYFTWAGGYVYHREISRLGIVSAMSNELILERHQLAAFRPYLWSYAMAADEIFASTGEWICARLAGRPAEYAGVGVAGQQRTFGVILRVQNPNAAYSLEPLEDALAACGESSAVTAIQPHDEGMDTLLLRMREEGVTTILCLCSYQGDGKGYWPAASTQGYFPEWLTTTFGAFDNDNNIKLWGQYPEQSQHLLGLTFLPRQVPLEAEPFWWALREGHPGTDSPPNESYLWWERELYRSLLLLVSGIQMAGPTLTPETLEQGLHRTTFPNPDHPNMAGRVGFTGHSHSMTQDAAEWWWSNTARSPYGGSRGSVCYLNGGARHQKGSWPAGDAPFFEGACDSGI